MEQLSSTGIVAMLLDAAAHGCSKAMELMAYIMDEAPAELHAQNQNQT